MNVFYNLPGAERAVAESMKEIQREAKTVRSLRKAGLGGSGAFDRAAVAFGSTLVRLGQRLQQKHAHTHKAYQTTSGKYAT